MTTKCLVTKLSGVVSNDALLHVGELRIKVLKEAQPKLRKLSLNFEKECQVKIIGEGYFTDSSSSTNEGTIKVIPSKVETDLYLSNGEYEISIGNKYSLLWINIANTPATLNISDIKYSKSIETIYAKDNFVGDIADLSELANLHNFEVDNSPIEGDIIAFKGKELTYLRIVNSKLYGDIANFKDSNFSSLYLINNPNLYGELSELKDMPNMSVLYLQNCPNTKCKTSDFAKMTNLRNIVITNLSGDISSFQGLSNLKEIISTNGDTVGDLAILPKNTINFDITLYSGSGFTWTNRPSSSKAFSITGFLKIDNIDKMLNNLADCYATSGGNTSYKVIQVTGTRTSTSDSAVEKLQGYGYTISIKQD